nr:membrane-targeted effector domain-containing toxin [uncultured Pseudomonas sp.]
MSTPSEPTLEQLHAQLLQIDPSLRNQARQAAPQPQELLSLQTLNTQLKQANERFLTHARTLYQDLTHADLTQPAGETLLRRLQTELNQKLQDLDETSTLDGHGRKAFIAFNAGSNALELEAALNVKDHLLSPADQRMVEDCSRGPTLRPGFYALTFTYQDQTVEFAGACVLTRQPSTTLDNLTSGEDVGPVLLFTPSGGLQAVDSLRELDQGLRDSMAEPGPRAALLQHLPARYQHLDAVGIWPLALRIIEGQPLFEYLYQAMLDKRRQDIDLALTQASDTGHLIEALDTAIKAALPDLSQRLETRRVRLLELALHNRLPDWFRNADNAVKGTVVDQVDQYNQARQTFINLLGPWATPSALAHYLLIEALADQLDIHDLDPHQLIVSTRRTVPSVGTYEQRRTLVDLVLGGLHTGDNQPGSAFLDHTTLTYADQPLRGAHRQLTAQTLLALLLPLQPRLTFSTLQKKALASAEIRLAARRMYDQRLVLLAFIAKLQGHLSAADHALFEQLRDNPDSSLRAQTVLLHGAQLQDLWVLRETDASGQIKRLLLCVPGSPRQQAFITFNSLRECQTHILAWADTAKGTVMRDYLVEQVPLRFRPALRVVLAGLGFTPQAMEHEEITFGSPCKHTDCLDAMVARLLAQMVDDYEHGSPLWFRSASQADRTRLTTLAEDAAGALRLYNQRPDSEANFPTFNTYLHEQAKRSLNTLLGRAQNDIDPDLIFAYSPKALLGQAPAPVSYTQLYRDGYADGIGFLDEKFSRSATFRGPAGIDLKPLTAEKVARSVTGVWIGKRYTDLVRTQLQAADSPGYAVRRDATLKIIQLQMKSAALASNLEGHIARVDMDWLELAIDSLGHSAATLRNTYKVHRLMIDGDWVMGVYLFSHADNPVLLYTPNTPDGVTFREARLFNYLLKKVDGMPGYFCNRVAQQSQVRIRRFLETAAKGLPNDIDRTTPSPARHDPIAHITPLTDLRHDTYNMVLQRKIDDVHATTVDRTQKIMDILWVCVEWVSAVVTIPFPLLSLTLGGLLAFKDAMLALSALNQGDRDAAFKHYLGYLLNIGGAFLFDLRPALTGPFNALSATLKAGKRAADIALIKQLEPATPPGMQPVLFDGQPYWITPAPDALGRHLLYRQDPASGQMRSTARLVNQAADGRWVRSGVVGGGRKRYEELVEEVDNPLAAYEISPGQGANVRTVLDPDFKTHVSWDWEVAAASAARFSAHDHLRPLREAYNRQVEQLTKDADAFYKVPRVPAAKAEVPVLAVDTPHADLLKGLFTGNRHLVVGARNASIASKQLLIENMQLLSEQGLKRLYIENLPIDVFRSKLKIINREVDGNVAAALRRIEEHLARVDHSLGYAADAPFTYRKLVLKAHKHHVAIDGLDASSSYHLEHVLALGDGERLIPRSSRLRNFYSHKAIQRNVAQSPGEGWIALAEQDRLGAYASVPGLADLQNTLALRVEDVAVGQPVGIWVDTFAAAQSRGHYKVALITDRAAQAPAGLPQVTPVPVAPSHFNDFDVPVEFRKDIEQLSAQRHGLDSRYALDEGHPCAEANASLMKTRGQLYATAKTFFTDFTPSPRPSLALLAGAKSDEAFLEQLAKMKRALVIGEAHADRSSKQYLIKHMKWLKQQDFKTLYVEHLLTDLHQAQLDVFHQTGKMPDELKAYLRQQDEGHMRWYTGPSTYTNVIIAANKYGIRVRALDCAASYHVKGMADRNARNILFSYFANEVIKADQAAYGPHNWAALMGSSHTDMNLGVPGIVQLQNAVSLNIRDVAPNRARSLHAGGWELVHESGGVALRSDFKLEVGVAGKISSTTPVPGNRARLRDKGHFLIEQPSATEIVLVHRSRSDEIISTPIQVDNQGRFFIERWEKLRDQRFLYENQLIQALRSEVGLFPAP